MEYLVRATLTYTATIEAPDEDTALRKATAQEFDTLFDTGAGDVRWDVARWVENACPASGEEQFTTDDAPTTCGHCQQVVDVEDGKLVAHARSAPRSPA